MSATEGGVVNMAMDPEAPPPSYEATVSQHIAPPTSSADLQPPSYERIDNNTADSPPSYDSLYGQVRAAKADSNSVVDFFKKLIIILLNTIGFTIGIGLLLAIPISMIVIGSVYISDCPRQPYIPIFLIVGGCFGVIKNLLNMSQRCKKRGTEGDSDNSNDNNNTRTGLMDGTLTCFLVAWFIAGNVWVYGINGDYSTYPSSYNYCNSTLYLFSFWLITGLYIMFGLLICCICFTGCIFAGLATSNAS